MANFDALLGARAIEALGNEGVDRVGKTRREVMFDLEVEPAHQPVLQVCASPGAAVHVESGGELVCREVGPAALGISGRELGEFHTVGELEHRRQEQPDEP